MAAHQKPETLQRARSLAPLRPPFQAAGELSPQSKATEGASQAKITSNAPNNRPRPSKPTRTTQNPLAVAVKARSLSAAPSNARPLSPGIERGVVSAERHPRGRRGSPELCSLFDRGSPEPRSLFDRGSLERFL